MSRRRLSRLGGVARLLRPSPQRTRGLTLVFMMEERAPTFLAAILGSLLILG